LLALESVNRPIQAGLAPSLEAEAALHHVLQAVQRRAVVESETGVTVSPDGMLAAVAAEDGTIRLWPSSQWTTNGRPSGEPARVLGGSPGYHAFSFDSNHRLLADGAEDGSITVWDTNTGKVVRRLTGLGGPIGHVALADDGSILAARGFDRRVKVWETSTGEERLSTGPAPAGLVAMALSPDGSALATGDEAGAVVVWNTADGEKTSTLADQFDRISDIRFCSAGRLAVSTPAALSMWNVATGVRTPDLLGFSPLAVGTFACDSDSDRLAISGMTADIKLLEAATGHELAALPDTPGAVDLAFSNDGLLLYVHTPAESIEVWESYGGGELAILPTRHGTGAVAISPDGAHVATGFDRAGALGLWDVPAETGRTGNGSSAGPQLRIWNKWHESAIYAVAFSPDGRQLATADSSSVVKIADVAALTSPEWQTKSPTTLPRGLWGGYRVLDLTFSPDGRRLAAVTPNVLEPYEPLAIWDLGRPESGTTAAIRSWRSSLELPQWIFSATFSPDGRQIVLGLRGGPAEARNADDGILLYSVPGKDWGVNGAVFTPDGKRLITDSTEGAFNVWQLPEPAAGSEARATHLFRVRAHDSSISQMVLTPDGSRLITGSTDGTVKAWEATTGRPLLTLTAGAAPVLGLSLSADGERLAVASDAVRVYLLPLKALLALANSRVTRALSPEERATYLHESVASTQTATAVGSPATTTVAKRTQHLVRAFVNSFNRMDGYAVGSLFASEFSYNLNTLWGRGELPITSRGTLIATIYFLSRGEGGRWTLLGCDPPRADQSVVCRMTYISESFKAMGRAPAEFDAVFLFDGDKIKSVDGEPPDDQLELAQWEMYEVFGAARLRGDDLYQRLNAMDQNPPGRWESEALKAAEAGGIWLKMYQRYAAYMKVN
jgi:WD40 repeat protein